VERIGSPQRYSRVADLRHLAQRLSLALAAAMTAGGSPRADIRRLERPPLLPVT
jgi:hypothetical protein